MQMFYGCYIMLGKTVNLINWAYMTSASLNLLIYFIREYWQFCQCVTLVLHCFPAQPHNMVLFTMSLKYSQNSHRFTDLETKIFLFRLSITYMTGPGSNSNSLQSHRFMLVVAFFQYYGSFTLSSSCVAGQHGVEILGFL